MEPYLREVREDDLAMLGFKVSSVTAHAKPLIGLACGMLETDEFAGGRTRIL